MTLLDTHFALLNGLKSNLPKGPHVHQTFVNEYCALLRNIEQETRYDLKQFDIPPEQVGPVMRSSNYVTGQKTYSTDKYCSRAYFMMKLDALLLLFQIRSSDTEIGFKTPSA